MMQGILKAHRALGVVFLCLLLLAVWLTYAVFTKKFADYEEIRLQASSTGLQLPSRADVKIRGVIVGEVLEAQPENGGAELVLGIYPDKLDLIPANVSGSIVPKTLFGEKYVALVVPESGPSGNIEAGATIEKTQMATEVEQVLSDLYPLLQTVRPADLNMTLNAMVVALEGRGERLGETLETADAYLRRMNPQIPALLDDLALTAEVSDIYAGILPEVAQILDNTVRTTQTLEEREARLNQTLRDITAFSETARGFLARNGDRMEQAALLTTAQLELLAKYSPQLPCVLGALVNMQPGIAGSFRGNELHIDLEMLPNQPRDYTPADRPRVAEDRGPRCYNLPDPPWNQANPYRNPPNFNDGVDEPTGKGTMRVVPGFEGDPLGYHGTTEDIAVLREVMVEEYGAGTDSDLGVLLAGPLAAGGGER